MLKKLYYFLLMLSFGPLLSAMEGVEGASFSSVMGQSLIKVGKGSDGRILIKEGTFFKGQNKVVVYKPNGEEVDTIVPQKPIGELLVDRREYEQFAAPYGNGIALFDATTGKVIQVFDTDEQANPANAMDFHFNPNGSQLVCTKRGAVQDKTYIFDIASGKPIKQWPYGYNYIDQAGVLGVCAPPLQAQEARSFGAEAQNTLATFAITSDMNFCSPDARYLVAGEDNSNEIMYRNNIYDTESGQKLGALNIDPNWSFFTEQFSPDSKYLAQVTDQAIALYDVKAQKLEKILEVDKHFMPFSMWFSKENKQLITVSNDSLGGWPPAQQPNVMRLAVVARKLSEKRMKEEMARTTDENGKGIVNIWNVDLEASAQAPVKSRWWPF